MNTEKTKVHQKSPTNRPSRTNKPMIEKRRRDRINSCLIQLKSLIVDAKSKELVIQPSKLEKADILELTVGYIQDMLRRKKPDSGSHHSPTLYARGYERCLDEVSRYFENNSELSAEEKWEILSNLRERLRCKRKSADVVELPTNNPVQARAVSLAEAINRRPIRSPQMDKRNGNKTACIAWSHPEKKVVMNDFQQNQSRVFISTVLGTSTLLSNKSISSSAPSTDFQLHNQDIISIGNNNNNSCKLVTDRIIENSSAVLLDNIMYENTRTKQIAVPHSVAILGQRSREIEMPAGSSESNIAESGFDITAKTEEQNLTDNYLWRPW